MKTNIIVVSIASVSLIICAYILGNAYQARSKDSKVITVTGLAEKNFASDLIIWRANFSRKSKNIKEAYTLLKQDEQIIRNYLKEKNVNPNAITFSSIRTNEDIAISYEHDREKREFLGYILSQSIEIKSKEIDKIEQIAREITELLDKGLQLNSTEPEYYYTKLADLKMNLLAEASKDGRLRAGLIAENSGSELGDLLHADMGVFQITGEYSNEDYSWGGTFNTSSKNKVARITIKMKFDIH